MVFHWGNTESMGHTPFTLSFTNFPFFLFFLLFGGWGIKTTSLMQYYKTRLIMVLICSFHRCKTGLKTYMYT